MALNIFLRDCLAAVARRPISAVTFVLGNEGGDMDSAVGSLFLAYYLAKAVGGHRDGAPSPVVPLLNFPVDDLALRGDVLNLVSAAGIDLASWCFTERGSEGPAADPANPAFVDLGASPSVLDDSVRFVLFDHNALCKRQAHLAPRVVGIIDHHADERKYLDDAPASPFAVRDIRTVGSASSLVALLFRDAGLAVPAPHLLFAPISLDTYNFDAAKERVTDADRAAAAFLAPLIRDGAETDASFSPDAFYERLFADKFSVSHLTAPQALRRDYKVFTFAQADGRSVVVGISSVLERAGAFMERIGPATLAADLSAYCEAHKLDALLLMFAATSDAGTLDRELVVFVPRRAQNGTAAAFADLDKQPLLAEAQFRVRAAGAPAPLVDAALLVAVYDQTNSNMSRKTLTPVLSKYFGARSEDGFKSNV